MQWYRDLFHTMQALYFRLKRKPSIESAFVLTKGFSKLKNIQEYPFRENKYVISFLLIMTVQMISFSHRTFGQTIEPNNDFERRPSSQNLINASRVNTQGLKTKFIFTAKENQIPVGGKEVKTKRRCKLSQAKRIAKNDQSINYFYIDRNKTGHFYSGDYSLRFSKRINTYLVAEIYDTDDETTKNNLYQELSKQGKFKEHVRMDPFPNNATRNVVVGFVFCDFGEKINGNPDDIERFKNQLLGKHSDGSSAFQKFIQQESNGKIEATIDVYKENGNPTWVNLIDDESQLDYKHFIDYNNVRTTVDSKINYPDHWDVVIYAFPDKASSTDPDYGANNNYLSGSQSQGKMIIDREENSGQGQAIRHLYMNPRGYNDQILHTITIHEMLHAFGLPDLYLGTRSYGWSMMSARHAAQHILQHEKIMLRWENMKTVCFLKRGIIDVELVANNARDDQYKLLVFSPGGSRNDYYFMEVAQLIGKSEEDRNQFIQENSKDYGVLLMMFNNGDYETITPFSSKLSPQELGGKYAGSSKGTFKSGTKFNTNGVFSQLIEAKERQKIRCIVGVDANFQPSNETNILRVNEKIKHEAFEFGMSFTGTVSFENLPFIDYNERPIELNVGYLNAYAYCAFVDDFGQFHLGKYDDIIENREILQSIPIPDHLTLSKGDYYLKLEAYNEDIWLSVYKDNVRQYNLLRPGYLNCNQNKYRLASYGNVYEYRNSTWNRVAWHMKGIACDNGTLYFYSGDNTVHKYLGQKGHWEPVSWTEEESREISINALLDLGMSPQVILESSSIERTQLYGKEYMGGIIFELSKNGSTGMICYPDEAPKMSWNTAKEYCEGLGNRWYFPSKEEVKLMRTNLPSGVFAPWYYWSSTEDENNVNRAWVTSPNSDLAQWPSEKSDKIYVRAVRTF